MTGFHSDSRPRQLTGRPTWLDASAVLPHLLLDPQPDGQWLVHVMCAEDGVGRWAIQRFSPGEIMLLMEAWVTNPEETLRKVFGREPPKDNSAKTKTDGPVTSVTNLNLEDLGL